MNKFSLMIGLTLMSTFAIAAGQNAFMQNQAMAEVGRVAAQLDVVNNNVDDLSARVQRLESKGQDNTTRQEIDAIKASIQELRRELANQRQEIVKDITDRLKPVLQAQAAAQTKSEAKSSKKVETYSGPCQEYEVQSGDSLYLIAKAFGTSVPKLKEMNNLKNNNLRVGQKLLVPKQ